MDDHDHGEREAPGGSQEVRLGRKVVWATLVDDQVDQVDDHDHGEREAPRRLGEEGRWCGQPWPSV